MGIVRKESIRSTFFSYIGIVIGFISQTFIFTNLLPSSIVGLIRVLISFAGLTTELSQLSIQTATGKFFPYFRNKKAGHHGFLLLALLLTTSGFVIVFLLTCILRPVIVGWYQGQSPLFAQKFFFAFPIALSLVYITVFEGYLRMLYKIIFSTIVKEIYIRLFALGAVLLYYFQLVNLDQFLMIFAGTYALAAVFMIIYLKSIGELFIKADFSLLTRPFLKELKAYLSYTYITLLVHRAILEVDKVIIAAMSGLGAAGIYSVTSLMANVISMPVNAINSISGPFFSESFRNNDLAKIKEVYRKASLNQFIAAALLFLLIWVNADNFLSFMPAEYTKGKMIILLIGISKLIDAVCINSSSIILLSNYYAFMMFSSSITLIFLIISNIFLIKYFGISGAAASILFSVLLHNILKVGYTYKKLKIHPFNTGLLKALIILGFCLLIFWIIPDYPSAWVDLIIKTCLILVIYLSLTLWWRVSEDVNTLYRDVLLRLKVLINKN